MHDSYVSPSPILRFAAVAGTLNLRLKPQLSVRSKLRASPRGAGLVLEGHARGGSARSASVISFHVMDRPDVMQNVDGCSGRNTRIRQNSNDTMRKHTNR
ncbi:hypothetical protein A0H81_05605 [Grifola frondosa]|uniref:Uncharacterized protein n=1 Tax=Grifola frondosa TaxID=5627 RepID=A0A1C7MF09_GRIFR|nr:hypothetical protein A0H81_05605 [Grifola frondosa]